MNRQPRIQQLYRDLAAKIQMVRINGGTAEMFKPNAMASARPAARAAFARYLRAERSVVSRAWLREFQSVGRAFRRQPTTAVLALPAPGTSPFDGVYIQLVGRSPRKPSRPARNFASASEWAEYVLGKPSYFADCIVCQESTRNYDEGGAPICPACETVQFERKIAGDQLGPEANAEQLDIYNSYRAAKGLDPVTTWRRPR